MEPQKATISDINFDLINTYQQVRLCPEQIIDSLKVLEVSESKYYYFRNLEPKDLFSRAVRFLYLNRTAFSGMYRLNMKGKFNVPYGGGYRTPEILWKNNLLTNSEKALRNIEIRCSDFEEIINYASDGDVVFCDPTYTVTHDDNGFVKYNEQVFSWSDQERLLNSAIKALDKGALVIISNACHPSILNLYKPFVPITLKRYSTLSKNVNKRRIVTEYVFVLSKKVSIDDLLPIVRKHL